MAFDAGSEAVRAYLSSIQNVISRMATNSAACKTWCVTVIAALLALAIQNGKPESMLIGLMPLGLFFLLDAYYLSLEDDFRVIYKDFVAKIHLGAVEGKDLYDLTPRNNCFVQRLFAVCKKIFSFSIIPFYGVILATLLVTYFSVQPAAPTNAPPGINPAASPSPIRPG